MSTKEFSIKEGDITTLSSSEIKYLLAKEGLWPQYTKRIKNLEKIESELWAIYEKEYDLTKKANLLINLGDLQSLIANCYSAARNVIESDKGDLSK